MTYHLTTLDGKRFVCLPDLIVDAEGLLDWMAEVRDDDPDLYAELVHIYIQLKKP